MVKKLRKKLSFVIWSILALVFFSVLLVVNLSNYQSIRRNADVVLERMLDGQQPPRNIENPDNAENLDDTENLDDRKNLFDEEAKVHMEREFQSFLVLVDEKEELTIAENKLTSYTDEEITTFARAALKSEKTTGFVDNVAYEVLTENQEKRIAFLDMSAQLRSQRQLILSSIIVLVLGLFCSFFIAWFLSLWLVKPVEETFDKQKEFIADAGHELKTPITVINANIDTLEYEYGENKYFHYIKEEVRKMNGLITELLTLARLENPDTATVFSEFNLSRAVENASLPFESVAYELGIGLDVQVGKEQIFHGNEAEIKQVVGILLDNAIKHAKKGTSIEVALRQERTRHILTVSNTGEPIEEGDLEKIFEKFYRVDKSRNRSAGRYGLGLSIAKNIVDRHKGTILVESKDEVTTFTVKL